LSLSFTKALSGLLFGITATDWPTWLGVMALVLTVAACASLIPAVRAATVEPMQVLRDE
jgi:ABC-type lipoprotein release transport system permease subunit